MDPRAVEQAVITLLVGVLWVLLPVVMLCVWLAVAQRDWPQVVVQTVLLILVHYAAPRLRGWLDTPWGW